MIPLALALSAAQAQGIDSHGFHPTTTAPEAGQSLSLGTPAREGWGGLLLDVADDPLVWHEASANGTVTEEVTLESLWSAQLGGGFRPVDPLQLYAVVPMHLAATGEQTTGSLGDLAVGGTAWGLETDRGWLGFAPGFRLPTGNDRTVTTGRVAWFTDIVGGARVGPAVFGATAGLGGSDQPLAARMGGSVGWVATTDLDVVAELLTSASASAVSAWGDPNGDVPRFRGQALLTARYNPRPVGVIAGIGRGIAGGPGSPNLRAVLGISFLGPEKSDEPVLDAVVATEPEPEPQPVVVVEPEPAVLQVPLTVRVTNLDGEPLSATVRLLGEEPVPDLAASPDRDSAVETALKPGEWTMIVWSDGYAGQRLPVELIDEPVTLEIALEPTKVRLEAEELVILEKVLFGTDEATIDPASDALLEDVAVTLIRNPQVKRVEVQGHTDSRASDAYNLRLSQARVDAVVERLLAMNVAPERLVPVGYGESKPIASNETEEGMQKNRRVQFVILEQDPIEIEGDRMTGN